MSIEEKLIQANVYREAAKNAEAQKPKNEEYDLIYERGIGGKVTFYPIENYIGIRTTGNEFKFNAGLAKSLYEVLGKLKVYGSAAYYPDIDILRINIGNGDIKIPGEAIHSLNIILDKLDN